MTRKMILVGEQKMWFWVVVFIAHKASSTHFTHLEHIGRLARMSVLDTEVDGSNPGSSMLCP